MSDRLLERGRNKERKERQEKMSEQTSHPPELTVSATGACLLLSETVGRPGTESFPSTITPPTTPLKKWKDHDDVTTTSTGEFYQGFL